MNHQLAIFFGTMFCYAFTGAMAWMWITFTRRGRALDRANDRIKELETVEKPEGAK